MWQMCRYRLQLVPVVLPEVYRVRLPLKCIAKQELCKVLLYYFLHLRSLLAPAAA